MENDGIAGINGCSVCFFAYSVMVVNAWAFEENPSKLFHSFFKNESVGLASFFFLCGKTLGVGLFALHGGCGGRQLRHVEKRNRT